MRVRASLVRLAIVFALGACLVPLEADTAEAGRIKFRVRSSGSYGSHAGERKLEATPERPRSSAEAASARARAALSAEAAQGATTEPSSEAPSAASESRTRSYQNGAVCIAGC
jgi:hypothetical protein